MKILWLKLDVEIFNNAKIKKLRRMAGGNEYFVLWVGLLTLGMKCANYGTLEISDGLPYTPEDFSEEFDLTVETVKQGLELFERLNMIKAVDGGSVEICDFRKHQSIERIEQVRELARARQAKRREKLQLTHNSKMLEFKDKEQEEDRDKEEEGARESRVTREDSCSDGVPSSPLQKNIPEDSVNNKDDAKPIINKENTHLLKKPRPRNEVFDYFAELYCKKHKVEKMPEAGKHIFIRLTEIRKEYDDDTIKRMFDAYFCNELGKKNSYIINCAISKYAISILYPLAMNKVNDQNDARNRREE